MGEEIKPGTLQGPYTVDFADRRLTTCYEKHFNGCQTRPVDMRHVHALMGVYDLAHVLGGFDSDGVHETIWHLLLPRLRPELRRWYQRPGLSKSDAAGRLRIYLNSFLREAF